MKKKKNGFTLIELLLTVAIMLTILGLAIVSFVTVSNRKKDEAFGLVKEEVLTAGKEFFARNSYMFDGFADGSIGTISLGTLVEEDLINKVVNPKTKKALSKCTKINVVKRNGLFYGEFDETSLEADETAQCDSYSTVIIQEEGAPKIDINVSGKKIWEDKDWYENNLKIKVSKDTENNSGKIDKLKKCVTDGELPCNDALEEITKEDGFNGTEYIEKVEDDTPASGRTYNYEASNSKGKTSAYVVVKLDEKAPECTLNADKEPDYNGWYNYNTSILGLNISGMSNDVTSWNILNNENKYTLANCPNGACNSTNVGELGFNEDTPGKDVVIEMTDKAGRTGICKKYIKMDRESPVVLPDSRQGITYCHDGDNITDTYGYSVHFMDKISKTTVDMQFASDLSDLELKLKPLKPSKLFKPFTVEPGVPSIYTVFVTRGDRASKTKLFFTDEAGNPTTEAYYEKKVGGPKDKTGSPYMCNVRDWYDAPVNQGIAQ